MLNIKTTTVEELQDGDVFSLDSGTNWHVCAVVLFDNVAVYTSTRRDDDAPTTRLDCDMTASVLIQ